MRVNSLDKIEKDRSTSIIALIIVAVIMALVFAGLFQGLIFGITALLVFIIKYWIWFLIGIGAILLIRKIFFRRKPKIQDVRVVR